MSNSSLKWSALIYGRTYEVDFRLIAMPEYFDVKARQWAENHILATTQIPEKLSGNPRWSLFTNEEYCVLATTCMVKELFSNDVSQEAKDITTDFRGRPLYAFIGYVAKKDESGKFPPLPAYNDLKLLQFQLSYQKYLQGCWDVKPYQSESKKPILTSEEEIKFNFTEIISSELQINQDRKKIRVWSEEYQSDVWNTVIQEINIFHQSISVCLGLSTPRDAEQSPFFNATLLRLNTSRDGLDVEKHINQPHQQVKETINPRKTLQQEVPQQSESNQYTSKSTNNILQRSNSTFVREKDIPLVDDRDNRQSYEDIVWYVVIYAFLKKYGSLSSEATQVVGSKFKRGIQSFVDTVKSFSFDSFNGFMQSETKQIFYDESNFNQDIEELAHIALTDSTKLRELLEELLNNKSCNDISQIVDKMLMFVSSSINEIGIKEKQHYISRELEGFELKAIDTKDNEYFNNSEYQSKPTTDDWF